MQHFAERLIIDLAPRLARIVQATYKSAVLTAESRRLVSIKSEAEISEELEEAAGQELHLFEPQWVAVAELASYSSVEHYPTANRKQLGRAPEPARRFSCLTPCQTAMTIALFRSFRGPSAALFTVRRM